MSDVSDKPAKARRTIPVPDSWLQAQVRERNLLLKELGKVRGLIPLLMKPRNGERWREAERDELMSHLHAIAHLSPYLVILLLPGSFVALPALAWWLDRRRQLRDAKA